MRRCCSGAIPPPPILPCIPIPSPPGLGICGPTPGPELEFPRADVGVDEFDGPPCPTSTPTLTPAPLLLVFPLELPVAPPDLELGVDEPLVVPFTGVPPDTAPVVELIPFTVAVGGTGGAIKPLPSPVSRLLLIVICM